MTQKGPRRIAVIGGGPGGAHCARRLAEGGLEVTLFEPREHFEKACGGGIPVRGVERFPDLLDSALPGKTIRDCLVVSPSGRESRIPLRDPLYVFSRGDLHAFLLDRAVRAGARLVRVRIAGLRREGVGGGRTSPSWLLRGAADSGGAAGAGGGTGTFGPFDFLVAADGAAGGMRRRLAPGAPGEEATQGIGYYLPGVSEDFITLKFYERLRGYLWVFPRPDHSSAGICATLGERPAAALRALMDGYLEGRYPGSALGKAERYAALIPQASRTHRDERLQGDGWALVGDAAGLVDPLTREGIYYAMLSADLLAEALVERRPERYAGEWERRAAAELSWAAAHADGFFDRRFLERLAFCCGASPAVARVLSDLIGGRQPYRTLKRRLLLGAPLVAVELAGRLAATPFRRLRDS